MAVWVPLPFWKCLHMISGFTAVWNYVWHLTARNAACKRVPCSGILGEELWPHRGSLKRKIPGFQPLPLLPVDANSAPWQAGRVMQHLSLAWRSLAEKNFVKSANAVAKLDLSKVGIALSHGLNGL